MHPKLKRVSPQNEGSDNPLVDTPQANTPETPNALISSADEPQARNAVSEDKFAYLRAQVRVFRRAY
jgi:hypothetical protein